MKKRSQQLCEITITPVWPEELKDIRFYRANERPFGAFSNLYCRTIVFEGREYPTAEHAFQAGKARKQKVREWILSAPNPSLVAMAAHGLYTWDIVSNWSAIKYDRMREVLRAKFTQHEDLRQLLLSTGEARLIEAGRADNIVNRTWGEVNGKGLNMLGSLLMEIRKDLGKKQNGSGNGNGRSKSSGVLLRRNLRLEEPKSRQQSHENYKVRSRAR